MLLSNRDKLYYVETDLQWMLVLPKFISSRSAAPERDDQDRARGVPPSMTASYQGIPTPCFSSNFDDDFPVVTEINCPRNARLALPEEIREKSCSHKHPGLDFWPHELLRTSLINPLSCSRSAAAGPAVTAQTQAIIGPTNCHMIGNEVESKFKLMYEPGPTTTALVEPRLGNLLI